MSFFKNFKNKNLIIAHRGFKSKYLENTLSALKNSVNKCDFLEFDVQFTKDLIPIIFHDEKLTRLTNIKKYKSFKSNYLKDYDFKDIKKLNIKDEKIPKLEKFLRFTKNKNIFFNLEIKTLDKNINEKKAILKIVKLIKKYKCEKKVLISAFNHKYLKIVNKANKKISLAALDENKKRKNLLKYLKKLKVEAYNINTNLLSKKLIKRLKKDNIYTLVYTINNKKEIKKLFKMEVKGVFTDSFFY